MKHTLSLPRICPWLLAGAVACAHGASYGVNAKWPLPGEGGWDYPSIDSERHLLYLSRATHVSVVDTKTGAAVAEIGDTPGVHGIALAGDLGRGFISVGKADRVKVFDLATRAVIADIDVGMKPDAILYDPFSHQVFAFNGQCASASVIDAATNAVVETVDLGGAPEFARTDGKGRIYVNLEDRNQLAELDAASRKVIARWPLPGCDRPTGLALDAANRRSFSVCSNAVMSILNTASGASVAVVPIGHGVDGAEFDPGSRDVFSANGEGTLTIVHETDPDHYAVAQTLPTARGARTIALDRKTHRLYLPTAQFGATQAAPGERPPILPGTFFVLVVAPAGR